MKTDITDAIFYGAWDNENDEFPDDATWFEKSSCLYFQTNSLIEDFGYDSYEDIERSGYFVPVFQRNIVELMKEFVRTREEKDLEAAIQSIAEEEDEDYSGAFRIFAELHPDFARAYDAFERSVLTDDAKTWAEKYGIAFFGEDDPDRKIVFSTLCMLFYYEEASVPGYTRHWLSKKDYSAWDQSEIDQMLVTGKLTPEILEKEYLLIPAITEEEAQKAGKEWSEYIEEAAKQWCAKNGVGWYIPADHPDHIKCRTD